ncbi:MAG: hypothetical protein HC790_13680 [Acaryochloridaceae cyanobacterium CSU_3_4]|nr:hypothetical protein [Acaryochloridaceae cyanobacterium CSU_3_4]
MDRSKIIAIITGIFSLLLGVLYLILVQLLDMRGEMIPAPVGTMLLAPSHLFLLPEVMAFSYS